MSRHFHIGDILSITTGRLVSERGIGAVYDILNYMTGDDLYTHQLPRAMGECKPHLIRQHPVFDSQEIARDVALLGRMLDNAESRVGSDAIVKGWLKERAEQYGETFPVEATGGEGK